MSENQPYQPESPAESGRFEPAAPTSARAVERNDNRNEGAWIWGLFLIALGVGFLLDNMGLVDFDNWWALFILIPAVGSFQGAWNKYREAGRLTADARGAMIGGIIIATVAFIFLFSINLSALWPVLLIGGGVLLLVNALLPG